MFILFIVVLILAIILVIIAGVRGTVLNDELSPQRPLLEPNQVSIPAILYKTGPKKYEDLDTSLKENFEKIQSENPDYKIKYYDDERCRRFIQKHLDTSVLKAYDSLIPGAYRADLFRYCVLYVKGGVYGDLSQQYLVPLNSLIERNHDRLVVVKDRLDVGCFKHGIQISFLAAVPGLSVFKEAIDKIVHNTLYKKYGRSCLDVTGPSLFRTCLDKSKIPYRLELEQIRGVLKNIQTGKTVIILKMKQHNAMIIKNRFTDYSVLWNERRIYRS